MIKWIIGYIDSYGAIHYNVIRKNDFVDTHEKMWSGAAKMNKWRWQPSDPNHINTYGQSLDVDDADKIWNIVDKYR